ncbi:MAG: undecaprenyl/decaprenyl-phosphate alpha-N-acetylglucosaminyl 1-phosphate transferase [Clostridia bacterium]|nr:undecaprenyl-phosphate alpha-N-acetylglucosaminyl 1-phosphate transferase [Bacillota bacterium]MBO2521893.1 undecaprenyl-phosphate alpha-N-acetylglucosaminyl 1-phosphate transferase [Bacillota bacterium]
MGHAVYLEFLPWLLLAFGVSWGLTPLVRRAAVRWGFVELPSERRIHQRPLPLGGGVALFAAFWVTVLAALGFEPELAGLALASGLVLLVGLVDDAVDLKWYVKLAGQAAAAAAAVSCGVRIEFVTHPLTGETVHIGGWGIPLTLIWLVALANMVNLIDGLDGLAAGVSAIASVPLFLIAASLGRWEAALMTVALGGAAAGFLPHNFNPARIIMGDSGAMFLGFTLGAISVEGALKGAAALTFVVPVLALGLPIFDTLFSIARRIAGGRPVYAADRDHLHHRLLALGLSQRQAVLILYGLSAVMAVGAVLAIGAGRIESLAVLAAVAAGAAFFARFLGGLRGFPTDRRGIGQ